MLRQLQEKIKKLRSGKPKRSSKGQAISEYGAVIAFIAVIIALTFAFSSGALGPALSAAFSSISSQMEEMADEAANASS